MKFYEVTSSFYNDGRAISALTNVVEADEIAGIAADDWLKLEDISEEACSELEKTLTAAIAKWLEKHGLKPVFYKSISSVQAHGIDDYFKKK